MKPAVLKAWYTKLQQYETWLARQPLSPHTRRAYICRIQHFLGFLGESPGDDYKNALQDPRERDFALRDYKIYMKRHLKALPSSVNATITAIENFTKYVGLGRVKVKREQLPQQAPRALDRAEQQRLVRAAERTRRPKDTAIALLLLYTGMRIGECVALDLDDIYTGKRKRRVIIRDGKGNQYREVPLHQEAAQAVDEWLQIRAGKYAGKKTSPALFLNPQGQRLSTQSVDLIIRKIGRDCGLELSAHILRHSCLTNLVRAGNDLVLVAEIGGHKRLETTKRYTLPTEKDRERAIDGLSLSD